MDNVIQKPRQMNPDSAQAIAAIQQMKDLWESSGANHNVIGRAIAIIRNDLEDGYESVLRMKAMEVELLRALRSEKAGEETDAEEEVRPGDHLSIHSQDEQETGDYQEAKA